MLMDKAHPSRWGWRQDNSHAAVRQSKSGLHYRRTSRVRNAQRPTSNAQRSIQTGRVERWAFRNRSSEQDERRPRLWHRLPADDLKIIGWKLTPLISRRFLILWLVGGAIICTIDFTLGSLSPTEARHIGHKIWQNECNGTISGLTSWNSGENFASLGIGHFIWYPEGMPGPFEESFPQLVSFMAERGKNLPPSLQGRSLHCPWKSRAEFLKAQDSPIINQLRRFLADTVDLQSEFLVDRLNRSLPKMLEEAPAADRTKVRENFENLQRTSQGCYALVDYVNFKGEGVLHSERYQGQGWGLLQVLQEMEPGSSSAADEFARAAATVLRRRVHNAPPARNEQRWLAGWLKRVNSYSRDW
jgi:hypothetical protein